jgi:hypothetical protein
MYHLYGGPEYEEKEPDLTGLDDAPQVREMARTVGAAAHEQAVDFLELCGTGIVDHFTGFGLATIANKRTRTYVLRNWGWGARVYVSSVRGGWFSCGVFVSAPPDVRIRIENDSCGVVVPWLWSRGSRKAEDAIWEILGGWPHSRAGGGLVDDKGMVALACIPIKSQPPESFDVDRDQLITEVIKTFARIGAEQTRAIASFVAKLNEPEEG